MPVITFQEDIKKTLIDYEYCINVQMVVTYDVAGVDAIVNITDQMGMN